MAAPRWWPLWWPACSQCISGSPPCWFLPSASTPRRPSCSVGGGHRPECSKPMPQLQVAYALATVSLARWTPIFTVHVVCLSSRRLPLRGIEDEFPPLRLSARCRFGLGQETFARVRGNGRHAPKAPIRRGAVNRRAIGPPDRHGRG